MNFFKLAGILVYALLVTSPLFHSHVLETNISHEDHCLGYNCPQSSPVVLASSTLPKPVFPMVYSAVEWSQLATGYIKPNILGSRSPPVSFPQQNPGKN